MGWFSAIKSVAKAATKVATAPTRITASLASRVLPKSIGNVVKKAATFNPGTFAVNKVTAKALSTLAPSRQASPAYATDRTYSSSSFQPPAPAAPSFFSRMTNAITQPSASPSSGQILSPAAVQAVAAQGGPSTPTTSFSTSWAGGGGGGGGGGYGGGGGSGGGGGGYDEGGDGGGGADEGSDEGGGADDPTDDMPDALFASRDDDGTADLGDIDYHAALEGAFPRLGRPGGRVAVRPAFRAGGALARGRRRRGGLAGELEGLGDWKSDLATFGKQVGGNVAKQAAVAIGNKLTAGAKPATPPPAAPGIPMAAKIAIGGVAALGVGYLVLGGRHRSSSAT
jgi:hypothetical protein